MNILLFVGLSLLAVSVNGQINIHEKFLKSRMVPKVDSNLKVEGHEYDISWAAQRLDHFNLQNNEQWFQVCIMKFKY